MKRSVRGSVFSRCLKRVLPIAACTLASSWSAVSLETGSTGHLASYHDGEISAQIKHRKGGLTLSIDHRNRHSEFQVPAEVFEVQQIQRFEDRLIVIGDLGASVSRLMIVSAGAGTITDTFDALNPALSPDHRFVAFVKYYPPHGASDTEDLHMLYDLTKSAVANRPAGVGLDDRFDVGVNVYPGNGNKPGDNVGVPEALAHQAAILMFWSPNSNKLVFADQSRQFNLVLVKVVGPDVGVVPSASSMAIDGTSVCAAPLSGTQCDAHLDQVTFGDAGLRTFWSGGGTHGSVHRELAVSYTEFVARAPAA